MAQKRRVACLKSMSYRRHRQTPNEKHEQKTRHADTLRDASYISSFSFRKFWRFSCKAKYARLRTLPRSLVGSRGSSFQPCNVPRRIKGFALRLVSGFAFRVSGCGGHGVTRPTVLFDLLLHTIPNIPCIPCIQWFNFPASTLSTYTAKNSPTSDIGLPTIHEFSCVSCISQSNSPTSTRSTRSTRLKSLTRNNSKLTFRPFGRFSASFPPPLSKIIHRSSRYSRLPLPSIGLNSMRHIIRFPLQYGKFTSILR